MTIQRVAVLYVQRGVRPAEKEARSVLPADPEDPIAHALLSLTVTHLDRLEDATDEAETAIGTATDLALGHVATQRH